MKHYHKKILSRDAFFGPITDYRAHQNHDLPIQLPIDCQSLPITELQGNGNLPYLLYIIWIAGKHQFLWLQHQFLSLWILRDWDMSLNAFIKASAECDCHIRYSNVPARLLLYLRYWNVPAHLLLSLRYWNVPALFLLSLRYWNVPVRLLLSLQYWNVPIHLLLSLQYWNVPTHLLRSLRYWNVPAHAELCKAKLNYTKLNVKLPPLPSLQWPREILAV